MSPLNPLSLSPWLEQPRRRRHLLRRGLGLGLDRPAAARRRQPRAERLQVRLGLYPIVTL